MSPRAYVSWSSGKDAAFALLEARRQGLAQIAGILTTIDEARDRVATHDVGRTFLDAQVERLGLPCVRVPLPASCPNAVYEARMGAACAALKADGIAHIVFGDIHLADVRRYRETQLAQLGMRAVFPLWGRDTATLARAIVHAGIVAHLVCVDPARLDRAFAGRRFDEALLHDLPAGVDPCGEYGEFHTAVCDAPFFHAPIELRAAPPVERDGFVYTDIVPA